MPWLSYIRSVEPQSLVTCKPVLVHLVHMLGNKTFLWAWSKFRKNVVLSTDDVVHILAKLISLYVYKIGCVIFDVELRHWAIPSFGLLVYVMSSENLACDAIRRWFKHTLVIISSTAIRIGEKLGRVQKSLVFCSHVSIWACYIYIVTLHCFLLLSLSRMYEWVSVTCKNIAAPCPTTCAT